MQLQPPSATPFAPQAPQSAELAQVLAAMRSQQPQTAVGGTANMVANALNTFGQQAKGQGGQNQWTDANGNASGNWFNSPLGDRVGGLFGLGKTAQSAQQAASALNGAGVMGAGF